MQTAVELIAERDFLPPPSLSPQVAMRLRRDEGGHFVGIPLYQNLRAGKPRQVNAPSPVEELIRQTYKEELRCNRPSFAKKAAYERLERYYDNVSALEWEEIRSEANEAIKKERQASWLRRKRLRRKIFNNDWNYFCTFTYDNAKGWTEDSFRESLNRCISNFCERRSWRCIMVWERGDEGGRLHAHGLFYIPEGEMVGKVLVRQNKAYKRHDMEFRHYNEFFEKKYGRSDFEPLTRLFLGKAIDYLCKYIDKSGERMRYSRHTPSEIIKYVDNKHLFLDYVDERNWIVHSIVEDGVVTWERDVRSYERAKGEAIRRQVNRDGVSISAGLARGKSPGSRDLYA